MGKNFKKDICAYCHKNKSTKKGDHIFARKLFLEKRRDNLPKVPSCGICNNNKSMLEQHLLTVLPFGARHNDATENLETNALRRLEENRKLGRNIISGSSGIFYKENGVLVPSIAIPIDTTKLVALFNWISRGLVEFHFKTQLSENDYVESFLLSSNPYAWFKNSDFKSKVDNDLGEGTITYKGLQGVDNDKVTIWEICVYGGLMMSDGKMHNIYTITGPADMTDNIRRRKIFSV